MLLVDFLEINSKVIIKTPTTTYMCRYTSLKTLTTENKQQSHKPVF